MNIQIENYTSYFIGGNFFKKLVPMVHLYHVLLKMNCYNKNKIGFYVFYIL